MARAVMRYDPSSPEATRRLLLVHGERGIRFSVADYFRMRGFEVHEAEDPETAWNQLGVTAYDVMLTDYHFGRRAAEGIALAARARLAVHPPVVCLLAPPLEPDEALAASHAVDLLITRPRPLPDLAELLFTLLRDRAAAPSPPTARG